MVKIPEQSHICHCCAFIVDFEYSLEIVLDAIALAFKDDFGYGNLWFLKF